MRGIFISNNKLLEINRVVEEPASWFINDTVQSDGSLYIATPVDPLFVIIKLLEENRKKTEEHAGYFCSLSQMLSDTNHLGYVHLTKLLKDVDVSVICDVNDQSTDQVLYRLNDDKLLKWMRCKTDRLSQKLASYPIQTTVSSAQASTFVASTRDIKKPTEDDLLRSALGFLSEYINPNRMEQLARSYGILEFAPPRVSVFDDLKKAETKSESRKDHTKKEKPKVEKPKLSVAQSKLAKTNTTGMSKISSFFHKEDIVSE